MAAYKEQSRLRKPHLRRSLKWIKQQMHRLMRREAKMDPENAGRKVKFWGTRD